MTDFYFMGFSLTYVWGIIAIRDDYNSILHAVNVYTFAFC